MQRISDLPGLGPKSASMLARIGVHSREDLERIGPVRAFALLRERGDTPSINLLYAMAGALAGQHWQTIARTQKLALLHELAGFAELRRALRNDGVDIDL